MSHKSIPIIMYVFCTQQWYGTVLLYTSTATVAGVLLYTSTAMVAGVLLYTSTAMVAGVLLYTRSECGGQSCSEAFLSCCGGAAGNLICSSTNPVNSHYGCQLGHCKPNYHSTSSSSGGGSRLMFWPSLILTSQTSWILAHFVVVPYTPRWTPT